MYQEVDDIMTQKSDPDIDKSQDLLYTISEVAALLKVNRNYVYKLIIRAICAL